MGGFRCSDRPENRTIRKILIFWIEAVFEKKNQLRKNIFLDRFEKKKLIFSKFLKIFKKHRKNQNFQKGIQIFPKLDFFFEHSFDAENQEAIFRAIRAAEPFQLALPLFFVKMKQNYRYEVDFP